MELQGTKAAHRRWKQGKLQRRNLETLSMDVGMMPKLPWTWYLQGRLRAAR